MIRDGHVWLKSRTEDENNNLFCLFSKLLFIFHLFLYFLTEQAFSKIVIFIKSFIQPNHQFCKNLIGFKKVCQKKQFVPKKKQQFIQNLFFYCFFVKPSFIISLNTPFCFSIIRVKIRQCDTFTLSNFSRLGN